MCGWREGKVQLKSIIYIECDGLSQIKINKKEQLLGFSSGQDKLGLFLVSQNIFKSLSFLDKLISPIILSNKSYTIRQNKIERSWDYL